MSGPHSDQIKYDGVIVQSSLLGIPIPIGVGTVKVGCNLADYQDFQSHKQNTAGKGGAPATYTYSASIVLIITQDYSPSGIAGVRTIWRDSTYYIATPGGSKIVNGSTVTESSKSALQNSGLQFMAEGQVGQAPWPYMVDAHPANALGYSGMAYAAAANFPLNTSATPPNFNFEIQYSVRSTVNGVLIDDALPDAYVSVLLPRVQRWPTSWPGAAIGDLSNYSQYCTAQGLWVSHVAAAGGTAADIFSQILEVSNSDCFEADGLVQIVPYGDTEITANGVTWTPDLTPIWDFSYDDLIPNSDGEEPYKQTIKPDDQCYNYQQVSFNDRTLQYSTNTTAAEDQASIDLYGRFPAPVASLDMICDPPVAAAIAQLKVNRSANVRRAFEFRVSELFEPMLDVTNYFTLPTRSGAQRLIRIKEYNGSSAVDAILDVQAEEVLIGTIHAPDYTRQSALGILPNWGVDPGDTNVPVIMNPPRTLTGSAPQIWIGASGGPNWGGCQVWMSIDGADYAYMDQINAPANYGELTSALPEAADPDTTDTPTVSLALSGGSLASFSATAANAFTSLCLIITGGTQEAIAYETATLTGANTYQLSDLRRGLYSTASAAHSAGDVFVFIDGAILKLGYQAGQFGSTVRIKLPAFNQYGQALQDLSLVEYYEFTLTPQATPLFDQTQVQGALATLNEVGTPQIVPYATTLPSITASSSSTSGGGAGTFVTQLSDSPSPTQAATLQITAQIEFIDGGGHDASYHATGIQLTVDGAVVGASYQPTGPGAIGVFTAVADIAVAAGTHVVDLQGYAQTGDQIGYCILRVNEVY